MQLVGLERRTARGGRDSIDHPPGGHDDVANAVAGALLGASKPAGYDESMNWVGDWSGLDRIPMVGYQRGCDRFHSSIGPDTPEHSLLQGGSEHRMVKSIPFAVMAAACLGVSLQGALAQDADTQASKPIASVQGDAAGAHVDILSLKRTEGGMVTLRLAFVNDSGAPVKTQSFPGSDNPLTKSIVLIDYASKRKYGIITFSDGSCLCNTNLGYNNDFDPGSKMAWAKFTAPPASVTKIAILFPGGEPVEGVPITQ